VTLSFFVCGVAKPAGSKRGFPLKRNGRYTGRVAMVDASGQAGKDWRGDVKHAAQSCYTREPMTGALGLVLVFWISRPKCHFGSGKNSAVLKPSAPIYPTPQPDATKLLRSVEDALTGIVWKDDAQIVSQLVHKRYCDEVYNRPGVQIMVRELDSRNAPLPLCDVPQPSLFHEVLI
jgi:Holliday junction resolvase RusA-like endonuclease